MLVSQSANQPVRVIEWVSEQPSKQADNQVSKVLREQVSEGTHEGVTNVYRWIIIDEMR